VVPLILAPPAAVAIGHEPHPRTGLMRTPENHARKMAASTAARYCPLAPAQPFAAKRVGACQRSQSGQRLSTSVFNFQQHHVNVGALVHDKSLTRCVLNA
jgi:hypothetical protein